MFRPSQEQKDQLKELGSTYKFINRGPLRERMPHGELEVTKPAIVICELRDLVTGKTWAEAESDNRGDALAAALNNADPNRKPKTVAEIAAENAELKRRLAEIEGKDTPAKPARRKKKPTKKDEEQVSPPGSEPTE